MSTALRIRIALDQGPGDAAALQWTARLARRLQAQIEARFIEDLELFQLAELPFTHRGYGPFNAEVLAAEMAQQASQLERQLRELTLPEQIPLQFSRVRGRLLDEIRRAQEDVALLVLSGFRPSRASLVPATAAGRGETVMVLFDGSEAATQALRLILGAVPADSLQVLMQAEDRPEAEQRLQQVQALLRDHGIDSVRSAFLPRHDGEHLVHLAGLERPEAIFLAGNNALLADHPLRELISALPCPLVIVGAS